MQPRADEIRDAALELIALDGMEAVSIRTVSRKAFLSPSGVYRHFPGITELLESCRRELLTTLAGQLAAADEPAAELVAWIKGAPEHSRFLFDMGWEVGPLEAELVKFLQPVCASCVPPRRLFMGLAHLLSVVSTEQLEADHVATLCALHESAETVTSAAADRWLSRETHHHQLEVLIEGALKVPMDPVSKVILQHAVTTGDFPTRRQVADVLGRSVSRIYPVAKGTSAESRVRYALTDHLVPALLAGHGSGLERFWDFLVKAGVLGLQYPALMELVATKPVAGRSRLEQQVLDVLQPDLSEVHAAAAVGYVLGNIIDFVQRAPVALADHFLWLARAFTAAESTNAHGVTRH